VKLENRRWTDEEFGQAFREVMSLYPTGREVDLDEAVEYLRALPPEKSVPAAFDRAKRDGLLLLNPRGGVATLEAMTQLLLCLQNEGGADILPVEPDSYSRRNMFQEAAAGLEESQRQGRSMLNGFPLPIHGVATCRRLTESVQRPLVCRSAAPRTQFVNTIAFVSGITEAIGSATGLALCMEYGLDLAQAIQDQQYTARLVGWFQERGVALGLDVNNTVAAGTIAEPSLSIAYGVIDSLIAAEQGARYQSISYQPNHHFVQDLAGMRAQMKLAQHYFTKFGYDWSGLSQAVHQWNGPFPRDPARAYAIIVLSTAIAYLGKARRIMVKSCEEGLGVPTPQANAAGVRATRQVVDMLRGQEFPESPQLREEQAIIETEGRLLIDKVLEVGDGDIAVGAVRAHEAGLIEFPFSINKANKGQMLLARDATGAVRFLDPGHLPFPKEIRQFHQEKLRERQRSEGLEPLEMLVRDLREVRAPFPEAKTRRLV